MTYNLCMDVNRIRKAAVIAFCAITALGNVKTYMDGTAKSEFRIQQNVDSYYLDQVEILSQTPVKESGPDSFAEESDSNKLQAIQTSHSDNSKINLNTASEDQLTSLKGIGPTKAKAIIDYRNSYGGFVAIEEITEVKGIGEGTFNKIKDYITIDE